MDKRDIKTLVVLGIIFGLIILIFVFTRDDTASIKKKSEFYDFTMVLNEDTFFSVVNNVNKLCEYSTNDINKVKYISTDIDYKEYENMLFNVSEIYVISRLNLYKYYIKGGVYTNIYDQKSEFVKDLYLVLNYDMNTMTFDIYKINKDIYDSRDSSNLEFGDIERNDYNEFIYTSLSDKSRAVLYFNDFINKVYNDIDSAYNILSNDTISNNFVTIDKFKTFVNSFDNIGMKEYNVSDSRISIRDKFGNEYIFNISSVLKYSVSINIAED